MRNRKQPDVTNETRCCCRRACLTPPCLPSRQGSLLNVVLDDYVRLKKLFAARLVNASTSQGDQSSVTEVGSVLLAVLLFLCPDPAAGRAAASSSVPARTAHLLSRCFSRTLRLSGLGWNGLRGGAPLGSLSGRGTQCCPLSAVQRLHQLCVKQDWQWSDVDSQGDHRPSELVHSKPSPVDRHY